MPPILGALAAQGLSLIANAVMAKGKDVIEKQLGVTIPDDPKALTPEKTVELARAQQAHEEFLINAAIRQSEVDLANTKGAREMQMAALQQGDLFSKRYVYYFMTFWSLVTIVYVFCITFGTIPENNIRFADTILGFLLGTVVATMFNFLLGSSTGSVKAQQMMRDLVEKTKAAFK